MVYLVYLQRCLISIVVVIWIQFPTVAPSEASEQLSFFWPLLAATMNHIIAGSLHVSFFQMVPLMPTQDAMMMVKRGKFVYIMLVYSLLYYQETGVMH